MKRILTFVAAILIIAAFSPAASAGNDGHFQGMIKGSGPSVGWQSHFTSDLSLGWRFNHGNYLGIGSGMHYVYHWHRNSDMGGWMEKGPLATALPFYADYIHYFRLGKSLSSFYLGMEAGGTYEIGTPACDVYNHHSLRPYLCPKFGFDLGFTRNIGISLGINFIAVPAASDGEYMLNPAIGFRF